MSRKAKNIYCNCCGVKICAEAEAKKASFLTIKKEWGYFSRGKDGTVHSVDLCEQCCDRLMQGFVIAPEIEPVTELL